MKILVYEATEIVPFEGLYEWLGDSDRIIFSNAAQEIQNFDSREVIRLLESINFDTVIFYIPSQRRDPFVKLVNQQFKITEWQEDNTVKFSIKNIGLIGKDALSRFFEKMRLIVGLSPKKACSKELIDAMNEIVNDDNNPIDAIFFYDINKVMLCQTENSAKPGTLLKFNLNLIVESLALLKNEGLKYELLEFDDGIVISYLVKNLSNSPEAIVGFITTVREDGILGRFLTFSKRYFNVLKDKCY
jgi:hypothetical protein